jgi:hypothetical protein
VHLVVSSRPALWNPTPRAGLATPGEIAALPIPDCSSDRVCAFDALVGHVRRYDSDDLLAVLGEHCLVLQQSAVFGMEPQSRWLLDFAVWGLTHRQVQAMRWYNRLFLSIGLLVQRRLACAPGLIDLAKVDELLLVCRRGARRALAQGVAR